MRGWQSLLRDVVFTTFLDDLALRLHSYPIRLHLPLCPPAQRAQCRVLRAGDLAGRPPEGSSMPRNIRDVEVV